MLMQLFAIQKIIGHPKNEEAIIFKYILRLFDKEL